MKSVHKQRSINGSKRPGGVTGKGFQPGKSGNPGGPPKGPTLLTEIRNLLAKANGKERKAVAESFVRALKAGSMAHAKEIIEREDGKVPDKADVGGEIKIVVEYVDAPCPKSD